MARTFLITGGCGFIGSHLVDAILAGGDRARVLDDLSSGRRENLDPAADLIVGSVTDAALVRDAMGGVDGCFHLAAVVSVQRAVEDWLGTHRVNQGGTVAVLDAARRNANVPVIFASSAAVYGDSAAESLEESAPTRPLSAYGADKLGCELHAQVAWSVHGVPNTALRIFNAYGPRQDAASPYSGVVAIFSERISAGSPLVIHGDGQQVRDFIFVKDVVEFFLAAFRAQKSGAHTYNVCTGRGTTLLELAAAFGRISGRRPQLTYTASRIGDIRRSVGDPRRATKALDVVAATALESGLRTTLAMPLTAA